MMTTAARWQPGTPRTRTFALAHAIKEYAGEPGGRIRTPELDALWWAADSLERMARDEVLGCEPLEAMAASIADALGVIP